MHPGFDFVQLARLVVPGDAHHGVGVRYPQAADAWGGPWQHPLWVADWVDADGMRTRVEGVDGGREFARPAGTWHLYAAGTRYHERYARPERVREDLWFFFTLRGELPPLSDRAFAAVADPEGRLAGYARTMHACQAHALPGADAVRRAVFLAAIGEILLAAQLGGDGSPSRPWVVRGALAADTAMLASRVDALVMAQLARPPSLGELAESLGMSSSALSHRFAAETGMPVMRRARWLRLREARRLLGGGMPVKTVARHLGFRNASYFTSAFSRDAGVSPGEWAARNRRDG